MTDTLPERVTCPECEHEHTVHVLLSASTSATPVFVHRGYARCPNCGHRDPMDGVIEFLSPDPDERALQLDPNFEPAPEREEPLGTTEIHGAPWIRGAERPRDT